MRIHKNRQDKVSNNFTEAEIYNASYGTNGEPFEYSDAVIRGYQIIRDYYRIPVKPTATLRTSSWDKSKGRSGTGQHTKGTAGDGVFLDNGDTLLAMHQDILNKGPLYQALRKAGINGFGLYDNFFHIDSRPGGNQQDTANGSFAFWDNRTWTKKKIET